MGKKKIKDEKTLAQSGNEGLSGEQQRQFNKLCFEKRMEHTNHAIQPQTVCPTNNQIALSVLSPSATIEYLSGKEELSPEESLAWNRAIEEIGRQEEEKRAGADKDLAAYIARYESAGFGKCEKYLPDWICKAFNVHSPDSPVDPTRGVVRLVSCPPDFPPRVLKAEILMPGFSPDVDNWRLATISFNGDRLIFTIDAPGNPPFDPASVIFDGNHTLFLECPIAEKLKSLRDNPVLVGVDVSGWNFSKWIALLFTAWQTEKQNGSLDTALGNLLERLGVRVGDQEKVGRDKREHNNWATERDNYWLFLKGSPPAKQGHDATPASISKFLATKSGYYDEEKLRKLRSALEKTRQKIGNNPALLNKRPSLWGCKG